MNRLTLISIPAAAIAALAATWAPGSNSGPEVKADVAIQHVLTLDGANRVLAAAASKAHARGAGGAIAVVDNAGTLIAFQRLDGTFAAGSTVSIGKARTAALFRKPTKAFEDSINGGRTALAAVDELTPLQGGVPIFHEGFLVGAIGVSGAHSQVEDEEIALAGAAAISPASADH